MAIEPIKILRPVYLDLIEFELTIEFQLVDCVRSDLIGSIVYPVRLRSAGYQQCRKKLNRHVVKLIACKQTFFLVFFVHCQYIPLTLYAQFFKTPKSQNFDYPNVFRFGTLKS